MFLNDLGQPLILDRRKTYGPYEEVNNKLHIRMHLNNIKYIQTACWTIGADLSRISGLRMS